MSPNALFFVKVKKLLPDLKTAVFKHEICVLETGL